MKTLILLLLLPLTALADISAAEFAQALDDEALQPKLHDDGRRLPPATELVRSGPPYVYRMRIHKDDLKDKYPGTSGSEYRKAAIVERWNSAFKDVRHDVITPRFITEGGLIDSRSTRVVVFYTREDLLSTLRRSEIAMMYTLEDSGLYLRDGVVTPRPELTQQQCYQVLVGGGELNTLVTPANRTVPPDMLTEDEFMAALTKACADHKPGLPRPNDRTHFSEPLLGP